MSTAEYSRAWREKNKEKSREHSRKWRENNREAHGVMNRKWNSEHPDQRKASSARFKKSHPQRNRAHSMLSWAVKNGKIQKQPCRDCGAVTVDGHHDDYSKPLDVIWLCKLHHQALHNQVEQRKEAKHGSGS
jgi:hypothetical protein